MDGSIDEHHSMATNTNTNTNGNGNAPVVSAQAALLLRALGDERKEEGNETKSKDGDPGKNEHVSAQLAQVRKNKPTVDRRRGSSTRSEDVTCHTKQCNVEKMEANDERIARSDTLQPITRKKRTKGKKKKRNHPKQQDGKVCALESTRAIE